MRTMLAVLTCLMLLPGHLLAQDAMDTLGAAGAVVLAKQQLDVPQASITRFDPARFRSQSTGFHKVDVTYDTRQPADCRLAAAMWIMSVTTSAGTSGSYGEWTGTVECLRHSIDMRMEVYPSTTSWWLTQYNLNGLEVYQASNP